MNVAELETALYGGEHPGLPAEIVCHEAAHALAGNLLGLEVTRAELLPQDEGLLGAVDADSRPAVNRAKSWGDRRGVALAHAADAACVLAGPLSVAQRWALEVPVRGRDRKQFDDAVARCQAAAPPGMQHLASAIAERIESLLRNLLVTERAALESLAVALAKRGRLSGSDIERAVREHRARPARDWRTALELALRTGGR